MPFTTCLRGEQLPILQGLLSGVVLSTGVEARGRALARGLPKRFESFPLCLRYGLSSPAPVLPRCVSGRLPLWKACRRIVRPRCFLSSWLIEAPRCDPRLQESSTISNERGLLLYYQIGRAHV